MGLYPHSTELLLISWIVVFCVHKYYGKVDVADLCTELSRLCDFQLTKELLNVNVLTAWLYFVCVNVSWQYRIRPTVLHSMWKKEVKQGNLTNKFNDIEPNPAQVSITTVMTTAVNQMTDISHLTMYI